MLEPMIFNKRNAFEDFFNSFPLAVFDGRQAAQIMKADIHEKEDSYEIKLDVPGYKKEDITIEIGDNELIIKAKHEESNEEKDENGKVIKRERQFGSAQRSFYIGDDVAKEEIEAKCENGVLQITMPKTKKEEPQKKLIEIQ